MHINENLPNPENPFGRDSKKSLRVCVVSPLYHPSRGGIGRQALGLTERLESLGVKIFVIARKMKGLPEYNYSENVPVYRVWSLRPGIINLVEVNLLNIVTSLSFCINTSVMLFKRRREYDIVHFHGASLPLITNILLLKLLGKKVISLVAGAKSSTEASSLGGKYMHLGTVLIHILKRVDRFIAISKEIESDLQNEGYKRRKIVRIPNFIDQTVFYPADKNAKDQIKQTLGFHHEKIVIFAGRLVTTKGVSDLIKAWAKIAEDRKGVLLVILGGGDLESELKKESRLLGIEDSVQFCGFVENVRDYLIVSDVFAFPSYLEGLPNSVLEAMACGLPVVATKISGVVDVIKDQENGLLVDPGDVNQLSEALNRLLFDSVLASSLGEKALETIRENYDINLITSKYVKLYTQLAKGY